MAAEETKQQVTEGAEPRYAVWDKGLSEELLRQKKVLNAGLKELRTRLAQEQKDKHNKKAEQTAKEIQQVENQIKVIDHNIGEPPLLRAIEAAGKRGRLLRQFAGVGPNAPMNKVGWRILDRIGKEMDKYIRYPSDAARNAALLYAVATYGMPIWRVVPRLGLLSATHNVGKSTAMELLAAISCQAKETIDMSVAVLFRLAEERQPTFFIDEVDNIFIRGRQSEKADGVAAILNAGYKKRGAAVQRAEKNSDGQWEVKDYNIFVMAVIAGIQNSKSQLPAPLMSRTIPIWMKSVKSKERKKLRDEQVEQFELAGKFLGWWMDYVKERHTCDPDQVRTRFGNYEGKNGAIPDYTPHPPDYNLLEMEDARAEDIWEPLFTVACYAGGKWPQRARDAAEELTVKKSGRKTQKLQVIQFIELLAAYYIKAAEMVKESGPGCTALRVATDGAWMIPTATFIEAICQKPRDGDNPAADSGIPLIDESPFEGQGSWVTAHRIGHDLQILDPRIEPKRSRPPQRRGYSVALLEEHWDQHVPGWRERLPEGWEDITPGDADTFPGHQPESAPEPEAEEPKKGPKVKAGSITADDIDEAEDRMKGVEAAKKFFNPGPDWEKEEGPEGIWGESV